jgi:hypothetical protein
MIGVSDPKNGAFLAHAEVLEATAERLHLRYERGSVASMALEDRSIQATIHALANKVFGTAPELVLVAREPELSSVRPGASRPPASRPPSPTAPQTNGHPLAAPPSSGEPEDSTPLSVFSVDKEQRERAEQAALAEARNHPLVQEAMRVLGARLQRIELPKS